MSVAGLISTPSRFGPKETMDRLEAALRASGAASVGESLRPTEVLIFGNPKAGTPLMQAEQTIGIDLPLKVLVWQDAAGAVWLSHNDPAWLAKRHAIGAEGEKTVAMMAPMLKTLTGKAAGSA